MKTLLLMRHAKSSWKQPDLQDFDRPLAKRGRKDVPRMAELLLKAELVPEVILASPALRAQLTAEMLAAQINRLDHVEYLHEFYMAEPQTYLEALKALPDTLERVMIIGHNPGLEGLLQILSGHVETLPTAAIAYISLPIKKWSELTEQSEGSLIELWRPKDLK